MESSITLKNIEFFGKHAEIIEKLSVTQDNIYSLEYSKPPLFNRMLDSIFIAGLVGLICKKKGSIDKSSNAKKTIFSDTVYKNMNDINFYSAIPIIKERDLSKTIEIKRALFTEQYDGEENYTQKRFQMFYSYVLGGLEILYKEVLQKDSIDEVSIFSDFEEFIENLLKENIDYNIDIDLDTDLDLNLNEENKWK
ncbi:hypothetical protein FDC35_16040 [Clostridium botulinum]|nr:hypothetical protein [Clostridium botulinum]NFP02347.1 hypothetical protein [Clostridium botulinum]